MRASILSLSHSSLLIKHRTIFAEVASERPYDDPRHTQGEYYSPRLSNKDIASLGNDHSGYRNEVEFETDWRPSERGLSKAICFWLSCGWVNRTG
jgi:hypothetical protein